MGKEEIKRKFDEIVAFAEVEKFLDTPVKRYSSGMYVRLAFAVAAHLEPEILIVDEVLAVGDAQFQKKCLGKMEDVGKEGRTVIFVSHNMGAVQRLCSRAIVINQGQTIFQGDASNAVSEYLAKVSESASRRIRFPESENKEITILEAAVVSPFKSDTEELDISDPIEIQIHYRVRQKISGSNLSLAVNRDGVVVFRSWDIDHEPQLYEFREQGEYYASIKLPIQLLAPGRYSVYLAAGRPGIGAIVKHEDCLFFELKAFTDDLSHKSNSRGGIIAPELKWEITKSELSKGKV
jgi:lipopolysaccharide transport system ATP-binding protein